jgi:hypothetical protein
MPADISLLDFWTTRAIEALWRQQVHDCKHANDTSPKQDYDIETGDTEWVIVQYTPFTEPVWGKVINK